MKVVFHNVHLSLTVAQCHRSPEPTPLGHHQRQPPPVTPNHRRATARISPHPGHRQGSPHH